MDIKKVFGYNVRRYRKFRGLTQMELCKKAPITRPRLSWIENGQLNVTLDTVQRLANALDVRILMLFREDDIDDSNDS